MPLRTRDRVLPAFGDETAIDHYDSAVGKPRRREDPIAGARHIGSKSRCRGKDQRLLRIVECDGECHAAVLSLLLIEARPRGGRRQRNRWRGELRVQRCDQAFFPGLALELPSPESDEQQKGEECWNQQADPRAPLPILPHRAPGPPKRPSSALW